MRGISFRVGAGEIYGILGPNGAGKSTTMGMLGTLVRPTGGRAVVAGHDDVRAPREVRKRIGFAMQEVGVDELATGIEQVVVDRRLHGQSRPAAAHRGGLMLDQVGHEPHTLLVNWRDPSPALFAAAGAGFAVVLAADVRYEQKDVKPLGTLLDRIVAPGGEVWIADPGRDPIADLLEKLHRRGWRVRSEECASARPDPNYHTRDIVTVHRLRRPPH